MKKFSRAIFIGALMLIVLSSACNLAVQTAPPSLETILPNQTQSPLPTSTSFTATDTPVTPVIPITGENVVQMQCQFCVNGFTHAILVFPEFAIFDVETTSPVTCLTAEIVNGKRVLICNGTQLTTFNLKICSDASNCLLFPVALQPCPLAGTPGTPFLTSTPLTPVFLTPINTLRPPTSTRGPGATRAPTQTSAPTETPPAPTTYP